ncbi:MAG: hypothetical protein J2P58_02625 [Acidimicrobiaceae bacterium]|nr:hypothetical protein [Acidimicrobiaceae bacterium]
MAAPESRLASQDETPNRTPGKYETTVRARRDPEAEARGIADRGTGTNQYLATPATRPPPAVRQATASRATEQPAIDPAVSRRPAPDAFRGTELYYIVGDEYFRGTSTPPKAYKSDYYSVIPQIRKDTNEVIAYVAYNPELRRNEFVIGPNELGFFFKHEALYKWLASSTYPIVGEPRPYEVQHGRMVASTLRGDPTGIASHFGAEWGYAVNDPVWWVRALGSVVGMKTAPVTSESATIVPTRGVTTSTEAAPLAETASVEPPATGTTTPTLPPPTGPASSTASSTEAAAAARSRGIAPPQTLGPSANQPATPTPVAPAPSLQTQGPVQLGTNQPTTAKLNEPSQHTRGGPLTVDERLRAERLLNRSLGQAQAEPAAVTRWGGQSQTLATKVIEVGPDGQPLVVEFTGRGVNGELVTVVSTSRDTGGRVVRLKIDNINNLERVARDTELARAMKAAGMGEWQRNLGHVQPSAAKGAEIPYNLEPQAGHWNKSIAGKVNRRTAETRFQKYLDSHPDEILNTEISRNLSKGNALLGERFRITDASGKHVLDVEVTTRGKLVDHLNLNEASNPKAKGGK